MLISELLGHSYIFEGTGIELQQAVDDIILRARKGNIENLGLVDLAGELNKSVDIFISPNDPEFRQTLTDVLLQNDWVKEVSPGGRIVIKKAGDFQPNQGEEPGEEVEKSRDRQSDKVGKIAKKNIRDKAADGGGELEL